MPQPLLPTLHPLPHPSLPRHLHAAPNLQPPPSPPHRPPLPQHLPPLCPLKEGQSLVVVGSVPELGSWAVSKGVQLKQAPDGMWHARVSLPTHTRMMAKVR